MIRITYTCYTQESLRKWSLTSTLSYQVVIDSFVIHIQWNLSRGTTAMRDHLSWQATHIWQDLHFNITEPVTRDHLSCHTTFLWPMWWSFKTGSTVYANQYNTSAIVQRNLIQREINWPGVSFKQNLQFQNWILNSPTSYAITVYSTCSMF